MHSARRPLALLFLTIILPVSTARGQRQMERLGRGVVALRTSNTQTYIGWRLLGNDPEDVAFNVYRSAKGAAAVKINSSPIATTTDYVDTPGNLGTTAYTYSVRPVLNGAEVPDTWANPLSGPANLPVNAPTRQYIPVPMQPTPDDAAAGVSYGVKFCWVGDVDGDGEYDFVVDRTNPSIEAKQWLQAYKRDGTLLWQMDMGPNSVDHYNITPGSSSVGIGHGDNVTVYDLDGDGKAEVIVRTANGVVFANGTTLAAPDNEVQYISIIDGATGAEKARAKINIPASWPTRTHVNGQMGIVYADGLRPSLFFHPSNRNPDSSFNKCAMTWDYRGGTLSQRWIWLESGHTAEGHQIRIADVDNDGKDEYVDIGNIVKSDGSGQINESVLTEVVHGDRFHVADIDPDRPGQETFLIQQNNPNGLATAYHAADKSAVIRKWYAGDVVDVGRGTIGSFVPSLFGLQMFSTQPGVFDSKGEQVYSSGPFPPETIWWDGDLGREFLSTIGSSATSPGIDKFNTANGGTSRLFSMYSDPAAPNSPYNNYIAYGGRPQFWGDILGDWREEVICAATDNSELRIYTTKLADTAKANGVRIYTLMHNPQYRLQATTKGYVQSSYVDYYLGYGMMAPPPPPMVDAKLVWKGGAGATTWDNGTTSSWLNNGTGSTFSSGDTVRFDLSGNTTTAVTLNGTLQPGALTVYNFPDYTFAGTGTLAGTMKLTKAGAGALVFANTHTFTGKTTVWDGALVVNGNLQGSPVTVWGGTWGGALAAGKTGGRIAGTGQFSQPVTIKYRGAVTPGAGMNNAGTLTFASGLTAQNGATFALDLSDDPTGTTKANDRIAVTGNLALGGTVKIVINPLNTKLAAGTYTLATYTGALTGGLANLSVVVPAGTPYSLAASGGAINLTVPVTRPAAAVTWRGSGGSWDLAASQSWTLAGSPNVFVAGDTVAFDATGAAAPTVTLATSLPVAGVTVSSATDYTFTGSGAIDGSGGLTKSGNGTLTLNTINSYTGPTTLNGGVLAVSSLGDAGSPSAIGASGASAANFVINGGTLRLTGAQTNMNRNLTLGSSGGAIEVSQTSSSIQISGAIGGSGALTKSGPGTLLLASANTYTGGTVINGGKIYLAGAAPNSGGLGSGTVTINSGTLSMADVQASETAAWNIVVPAGAAGRIDADGRCSLTGNLTGAGNLTFYTPYVRTDLKGNWSAFTGRISVLAASGGADFRVANTSGYANSAIDLGTEVYAYYSPTMSANVTMAIGELSGAATSVLMGGPTASRTLTWQVGAKNTDSTYAGVIRNNTGPTALTKVGSGTLTLSGINTYNAATTVSAGTLNLTGSLGTSAVSIAAAGTLGGSGTLGGAVTCNGTLAPGIAAVGTLSMAGNLTLGSSGVLSSDLGSTSDLVKVTGNLTLDGTVNVTPGSGFGAGTYTLISYSGTLTNNTLNVGTVPAGYTASVNTATTGEVKLIVTLSNSPPQITAGPTATPANVTGTSTALAVTATDTTGEAGLGYAWTSSGPATVVISPNGTNAAKATTATFTAPGSYTLTVTITDPGGLTTTASVPVNVVATASTITVSPGNASPAVGQTQAFEAMLRDQFGSSMLPPSPVAWSVSGGGSISQSGVFTATTAGGPWQVTATTSGSLSASAAVNVRKDSASIALTGLSATYDGSPKPVTATTTPPGLAVKITYDGAAEPPSAPGTYPIVAVIDDPNLAGTANGSLIISLRSYSAWETENFTSEQILAGESAMTADPDHDGLTNLAEYALGGKPYTFTPQPSATLAASTLTMVFQRPAHIGDVTYFAESGADVETWEQLTLEVLNPGSDPETVRATRHLNAPAPECQFIRLRFVK